MRSCATSSSSMNGGFKFLGNASSDVASFLGNGKDCFKTLQPAKAPIKLLPLSNSNGSSLFTDPDSFFYNPNEKMDFSTGSLNSTPITTSPTPNRQELTLQQVLLAGQLIDFAFDRHGVKFLEENYLKDGFVRKLVFEQLTESSHVFSGICQDANGNFIAQKLIECASINEQTVIFERMNEFGLMALCKNRYSCRVVQVAVQKFQSTNIILLLSAIKSLDLVSICTDQCSIHVIQRMIKHVPVDHWGFFVVFLCSEDNLMMICKDKYGCRLVQQVIDHLAENPALPCFQSRLQLLHSLMTCIARNCYRLSSNEFANYVIQYIIKSTGILEMYRDTIIERCLLRNLLSMSQDKFASHVIEGAFLFAPPTLLGEMMNEIFEGYVKDQESNRDALDILLFHQYGNYVVQRMIDICASALLGKEERRLPISEISKYTRWFGKIKNRVAQCSTRLERFSSGKKIIESIRKLPDFEVSPAAPSFDDLNVYLDTLFPSFLTKN